MNTSNITNYKPKDFAELLGVSVKTLQRWDREGTLKANRTPADRRYYTYDQYLQFKGINTENDTRKTVIYARVSTRNQKDDLQNQVTFLQQMTEEEITALKESLTNQIASNTTLTEQQKKEIEEEISKLNTETVSNLDDTKKVLQEEINSLTGDTEKINSAIESLNTTYSDLNKAKDDLSTQIKSNAELTKEEQQKLLTMINDLDTETGTSIEEIKETLRQNMSEQTTSLNNAVADLNTTIDTIKVSIENTNGKLQEFDNELQSTNNTVAAISSNLSNMTTDVWINEVTLPVSSFSAYDNGYACVITNDGFKTDSNVEVSYSKDTSLSVIDYIQQDGSLTIVVSDMPASDILIEGIHIENRPENN